MQSDIVVLRKLKQPPWNYSKLYQGYNVFNSFIEVLIPFCKMYLQNAVKLHCIIERGNINGMAEMLVSATQNTWTGIQTITSKACTEFDNVHWFRSIWWRCFVSVLKDSEITNLELKWPRLETQAAWEPRVSVILKLTMHQMEALHLAAF